MIVNKTNLLAGTVIGKDKSNNVLANVHINEDGDTIACNGKTVFVVESLPTTRKESIPFDGPGNEKDGGFSLPLETADKLVKAIPVDKHFDGLMELVHINSGKRDGDLIITSHDGKSARTVTGIQSQTKFIDYKGIMNHLYFGKPIQAKVILDRKRLKDTLATMDKICGDSPAYVEITEDGDLAISSVNLSTGQRVFSLIAGVVGEWQDFSTFVEKFKLKRKKKRIQRKGGKDVRTPKRKKRVRSRD